MSKADKDGWIRHRGGKQPLPDDVLTQVILRKESKKQFDDKPFIASDWEWSHCNCGDDVMYYREYKSAEQVEADKVMRACVEKCASTESTGELLYDPIAQGPLQWRDRIAEIDSTTQALTTERAELVQKLASEGFALIGRVVDPVEDMSDWRNWKEGDRIEVISKGFDGRDIGEMLTVDGLDNDDANQPVGVMGDDKTHSWPIVSRGHFLCIKWHSRPSA